MSDHTYYHTYYLFPLSKEEAKEIVSVLEYLKPEYNNYQKQQEIDSVITRINLILRWVEENQ